MQDPYTEWLKLKLIEEKAEESPLQQVITKMQRRLLEEEIRRTHEEPAPFEAPIMGVDDLRQMFPLPEEARTLAQMEGTSGPDHVDAKITAVLAGIGQSTLQLARGPVGFAADVGQIFTRQEVLVRARKLLDDAHAGIASTAEYAALDAGIDPEDIANYLLLGNVIGYTAPILGSVKAASLLLRSPVALSKWPYVSSIITDSLAGVIFGGIYEEAEDWRNRGMHMMRESALFGMGRIVVGGPIVAKTWRDKRFLSSIDHEEIRSVFNAISAGKKAPSLTARQNRILNVMMNEEQYLSSSVAAQQMFDTSGPHAAMIQAIIDVGDRLTLGGVLRMASDNIITTRQIIENARKHFPYLKFTPVKRPLEGVKGKPTHYDIYFGTRGLNNAQKAQLKAEGRFSGQMIRYGTGETDYLYVGMSKGGRAILQRLDGSGKNIYVKPEKVTDLPNFLEKPLAAWDAPFKDFRGYYLETVEKLRKSRVGITEGDVIEGIRTGATQIDEGARRAFDVAGAVVYPEELGYQAMRHGVTGREVSEGILREGLKAGGPLEPPMYLTFDDIFMSWARERGIGKAKDLVAAKEAFSHRLRRELWEGIPQSDKNLYEKVLAEQMKLVDEMRLPPKLIAHQKGFNWETLGDDSIMLREINSGARFIFGKTDDALNWLRGVHRIEADLPAIIPSMRMAMGVYNSGLPDMGALYKFDKLVTLDRTDLPQATVRNAWNWLQDVERVTGVPFWSKGMVHVDEGLTVMRARYAPYAKEISSVWGPVKMEERIQIAGIWRRAEKEGWSTAHTARELRREGVSGKGISAYIGSRRIFDKLFKETGLDANLYIDNYYSRIRPFLETLQKRDITKSLHGSKGSPKDKEFWFEFTRTGDLPKVEMDPEVVMHMYTRTLFWRNHVHEPWKTLQRMAGMGGKKEPLRFKDLPDGKALLDMHKKVDPLAKMTSPVVPPHIRKVLSEYLNSVRGTPHASYQSLGEFFETFFKRLDVNVRPEIVQDMVHCLMAAQYGAYIGIRPWHIARNMTQVPWLLYGRLGNKHMGRGLENAMSLSGMEEAYSEGVLRLAEAAVPAGDAVFNALRNVKITGDSHVGRAIAGAVTALHRGGHISRKMTQSMLTGYTSSDSLNRAWAYHWHKLHTAERLNAFEAGRTSWDKFMDDGLAYFSPVVKR